MWIFTTSGFFSAVQKEGGVHLRFRNKAHALKVRRQFRDILGKTRIRKWEAADYRWRMIVPKPTFVALTTALAEAVDYDNFKNACSDADPKRLDPAYTTLLHRVWGAGFDYQIHKDAEMRAHRNRDIRRPGEGLAPKGPRYVDRYFRF